MRIRWKLLILLLGIALIPLTVVTLRANRSTYRLGREIGERASTALLARAEKQLLRFVTDRAMLLRREGQAIEMAVRLQAYEVERRLAAEPTDETPVYYADDYDRPGSAPADITQNRQRFRLDASGQRTAVPVSEHHQVFTLAPGVSPDDVAGDVKRLASLAQAYRNLQEEIGELVYWQYTSLENGVHSCFPGHGGYPRDYDPRERPWYHQLRQSGQLTWTAPYVEVSTRQTVLTAGMPVHRPDGAFAGVTAIDIAPAEILARRRMPDFASAEARLVLLISRKNFDPEHLDRADVNQTQPADLGLFVLGAPASGDVDTRWQSPFQQVWLEADDPVVFRELLAEMAAAESGVRLVQYGGRPMLWAYAHPWPDSPRLLVMVDRDEIVASADQAERAVLDMTAFELRVTAGICLAVILLVVLVALAGSRAVTRPVRHLADAAGRVADGELDTHVNIHTRDELGELGAAFNRMVPQLRDRMRMRQSLSLAMEVQQNLLPAGPPRVEGLDVAGRSIYCDETGGDYYDFLELSQLGPRELGVAVGDVTGHGIAAALLMTGARALLRSQAGQPESLSHLMRELNRHLTHDTPPGRFMTLFFLVIDAAGRRLRWSSAGHDPAMLYDPANDRFSELAGEDIPLGIDGTWPYSESALDAVPAGSVILIGTDGIWEARNAAHEQFGKDRLRDVIRGHASRSADEISQAVIAAVNAFRRDHPQEDDVTLVVVKYV